MHRLGAGPAGPSASYSEACARERWGRGATAAAQTSPLEERWHPIHAAAYAVLTAFAQVVRGTGRPLRRVAFEVSPWLPLSMTISSRAPPPRPPWRSSS